MPLQATVYYDDLCNNDDSPDIPNDKCSDRDQEAPSFLRSGLIFIQKSPETLLADTNQVTWTINVTNSGSGTAYNVWVDDILGAGLTYSASTVTPEVGTGVSTNPNVDHTSAAINGVSWLIDAIPPGKKVIIEITANLVACGDLTNKVTANWGCGGAGYTDPDYTDCQDSVTDSASVKIAPPSLVNSSTVITPVAMCSSPVATITLRNSSKSHLYDVITAETLPADLSYVANTTEWRLNGGDWTPAADEPTVGSDITWDETAVSALADLAPGDVVEIRFSMDIACPFNGGDLTNVTSYKDPCGDTHSSSASSFTVGVTNPDVTVTKTRTTSPYRP